MTTRRTGWIVGEGLAALDVGGLLGRWVGKRPPRDDLGAIHGLLRSDECPQERALAGMALQPQPISVPARELAQTVSIGSNSANLYSRHTYLSTHRLDQGQLHR